MDIYLYHVYLLCNIDICINLNLLIMKTKVHKSTYVRRRVRVFSRGYERFTSCDEDYIVQGILDFYSYLPSDQEIKKEIARYYNI